MSTGAGARLSLPEPPGAPPGWDATIERAHAKLARRFAGAVAAGLAAFVVLVLLGGVAHAFVDEGGDGPPITAEHSGTTNGTTVPSDQVTISIEDAEPVAEPEAGETVEALFVVSLSDVADADVTVDYETRDQSALAGRDYEARRGTLTFAAGERKQTIAVAVLADDEAQEGDETFRLVLSQPSPNAAIADGAAAAKATIEGSPAEVVPTVSIADAGRVTEPAPGGRRVEAVFLVSLSGPSQRDVTVEFATRDGTATAGKDYDPAARTLTIEAGESEQQIAVPVLPGGACEADETFAVVLSNPVSAEIAAGKGSATATIVEPPIAIAIDDAAVTEPAGIDEGEVSPAVFRVALSCESEEAVTVAFETANGTATADRDYRAARGEATFRPGETEETVSVDVLPDGDDKEGDETFSVVLTAVTAGSAEIADGTATGRIADAVIFFTLTVKIDGNGSVTSSPAGIGCEPTCQGRFPAGTTVTLTARTEEPWFFDRWEEGCTGREPACTVTMDRARTVVAGFAPG